MTTRPAVLATRKLPEAVESRLLSDYDARLNATDAPYDGPDIVTRARGSDALIVTATDRIDRTVIEALPDRTRVIATLSVGYDHVDVEAARRRGICVTNTPGVLTEATAEIAILLILGAARRASEGERLLRSGAWPGWAPTQLLGVQVSGKHLGILGLGRIGQAVAKRARAFDMVIHYHSRNRLPPAIEQGAIYHPSADSMLAAVHVLSIHCPATAETRRFLDARRIARMRDGAIVVNTARGAIVDDEALVAALRSGKLAAAGLDVYDGEPALDRRYLALENTFLLPHLGSSTVETRNAMGFRCLDNLDAFFAGRPPADRVA